MILTVFSFDVVSCSFISLFILWVGWVACCCRFGWILNFVLLGCCLCWLLCFVRFTLCFWILAFPCGFGILNCVLASLG